MQVALGGVVQGETDLVETFAETSMPGFEGSERKLPRASMNGVLTLGPRFGSAW